MNEILTSEDKRIIKDWNETYGRGLDALEKAKQFKVGDYLVLYLDEGGSSMKIMVNCYGAPVKFKVIHSTEHSIPFCKKVNKKGTPVGQIYSLTGTLESDEYRYTAPTFEFRLDPDYADAILLDDEYDPAVIHRAKQEIFKEVTAHNKKYRVKTQNLGDVASFFQTVNVGDTLWTSTSGFYLVHNKDSVSRVDLAKALVQGYTRTKGPYITVLTVLDKKNKTQKITADFFCAKVLYTERPRSYKELKI